MVDAVKCSLCGLARRITREHIWPKGFLGRGNFGVRFSSRARRTFGGDLTVKDVCETCNNGPLSALDDHACSLYDSFFGRRTQWGDVVAFDYDYQRLTRWLMKTAFNSARAAGSADAELFGAYAPALLAEYPCSPAFVGFKIALVGPSTMLMARTGAVKTIYPKAARSGPVIVPGLDAQTMFSLRLIMINSFFFTVAISRETAIPTVAAAQLLGRLPGEPLLPEGSMLLMPTISAAQALAGVESWPRGERAYR